LSAEEATRNVIRENPDLIAVVCSSGEETLGAIQALKDTNKIGDVMVIGNDDYEEVLDYIERGLVYATVVADNELLGYEAIMNMTNHKADLLVSQYKDIRVRLITKSNLDEYRQEVGGRLDEE
ncbi:MAG: sugar ABC transporter substrate-binding protein, partial [Vallitaleaceae bacterium]|nr:sugar ABC transporter substrate-binding protein [Vallitaleaceae bacterium]